MCGLVVTLSPEGSAASVDAALDGMAHRGPDDAGVAEMDGGLCILGHRRLSILDLSSAGHQPMQSRDERYHIVFNGEIYNYLELREELKGSYAFSSTSDTEVLLAAYAAWGRSCLDKLIGMFAFCIWDSETRELFAARDRFGVKPLFYHKTASGELIIASEISAIQQIAGLNEPDPETWATYLRYGVYDNSERTFWKDVVNLRAGHCMVWSPSGLQIDRWYDIAQSVNAQGLDVRDDREVAEHLLALLEESLRLRYRADVPVGVCLSGGLDSSLLLGLIQRIHGDTDSTKTFTFFCGDERYDETPWVELMLKGTQHPSFMCQLCADEIPDLARRVQANQGEPYGGFPTLGMAKVHACAREQGVTVLLDGNGMDEGWAGYEYYQRADQVNFQQGPVQGAKSTSFFDHALQAGFAGQARLLDMVKPFDDAVLNLQYRDVTATKIPRAMRFADRVSMMYSRELREPFLDHRLLELGFRQPPDRKIRSGQGKWLPRKIADQLIPDGVREAPKRPVQTPQREWLREALAPWADDCIHAALSGWGRDWLDEKAVLDFWSMYRGQGTDNSFPVWQLISLGMMSELAGSR